MRDNPGQDLSGLNRDPANAMQVDTMPEVNVDFNPFGFVDSALDRSKNTNNVDELLKFFYNPADFFKEKFGSKDEKKNHPSAKPAAEAPNSAAGSQ